jgi:hypothetical protein
MNENKNNHICEIIENFPMDLLKLVWIFTIEKPIEEIINILYYDNYKDENRQKTFLLIRDILQGYHDNELYIGSEMGTYELLCSICKTNHYEILDLVYKFNKQVREIDVTEALDILWNCLQPEWKFSEEEKKHINTTILTNHVKFLDWLCSTYKICQDDAFLPFIHTYVKITSIPYINIWEWMIKRGLERLSNYFDLRLINEEFDKKEFDKYYTLFNDLEHLYKDGNEKYNLNSNSHIDNIFVSKRNIIHKYLEFI